MSVEEKRDAILQARAENQRTAERVQLGTAYHEPVTVAFNDRSQQAVEVYALSGRQFREAIRSAKFNPNDLDRISKKMKAAAAAAAKGEQAPGLSDEEGEKMWDFFLAVASAAVKDPPSIVDVISPGEEAKIAAKALEITTAPKK